ncbi:hypothetical protein FRC03_004724 [Tulasnella sp. 419]|nr:hypothetical protein FRC03_004724 [Tulasnella sp. 419]
MQSMLRFVTAVSSMIALCLAAPIPIKDLQRRKIEMQAHRGGYGLRPEETLHAFAYAMEVGADVLEMDMLFTKDGVPVIWHDHWIQPEKCSDTTGNYVGQYVVNLTLAEVKTLDCGSRQLGTQPQQEVQPRATIATLEEVLNLVECYGDDKVTINLETKLDPLRPNETLPVDTYINSPNFIPFLKNRNFLHRVTIQSFDWRTIKAIKDKYGKEVTTVALVDDTTIVPDDGRHEGHYPWLAGIDLEKDFGGSYLKAAQSIGASIISPIFGITGTVNNPKHTHFVTQKMVKESHDLGLKVIPWTVDDESSISYVLSTGVDGIISNFPERVGWVARQRGLSTGKARNKPHPKCLARANIPSIH